MSFQPQFPGMFEPSANRDAAFEDARPATEKQLAYAEALAARSGVKLPQTATQNRAALSSWIDSHKAPKTGGRFDSYPSSKQVAFAERIARLKRRDIPQECFRDKTMMSRWIDGNKPR